MWARTNDSLLQMRSYLLARDELDRIQNRIDARVRDPVKDIPAFAPVLYQPTFAQYSQLLGKIGLPVTQISFHMANAVLPIPQDIQNGKARRMGQQLEKL